MKTLSIEEQNNWTLFYDAIKALSTSQGFYGRLLEQINSLDETELIEAATKLPKFKDMLDVVFYLEQ